MKKPITVYSVVEVGFDYFRVEYYLGTYESEDKARQVIQEEEEDKLRRSIREDLATERSLVVVSKERYGDDREGSAPPHYWIIPTEINLE